MIPAAITSPEFPYFMNYSYKDIRDVLAGKFKF